MVSNDHAHDVMCSVVNPEICLGGHVPPKNAPIRPVPCKTVLQAVYCSHAVDRVSLSELGYEGQGTQTDRCNMLLLQRPLFLSFHYNILSVLAVDADEVLL